jgi:quercetin dioxygenase-like cupin family protein
MKRPVVVAAVIAFLGLMTLAFVSYAQKEAAGPGPFVINVESIMGAQLNPETEPLHEVQAGQTGTSTARVLMVHDSLAPHLHADHDEIILMLRGKGDLTLAGRSREVRRGDLIFLPKGTVHSFVSTTNGYSGLLSIVSPAYDGKDEIPAPAKRP